MIRALVILLVACVSAGASDWYVSTNGTGVGTLEDPWSFAGAIATTNTAIQPGDTIYIRGGTYPDPGSNNTYPSGTPENRVTYRPYTNELVTLSFNLFIYATNTTWRDIEFTGTSTNRTATIATGIQTVGAGTKLINLVIHDFCANGIGAWVDAPDTEIYGCLIYNNGYQGADPDRGHGHAIYLQNQTGTKWVYNNMCLNQFDIGIQVYTSDSYIQNMDIRGNTSYGNGILTRAVDLKNNIFVGASSVADALVIADNYTYHVPSLTNYTGPDSVNFGNTDQAHGTAVITNNYFAGGQITFHRWTNLTCISNIFAPFTFKLGVTMTNAGTWDWNWNTYYRTWDSQVMLLNTTNYTVALLQSNLGWEANGQRVAGNPTANSIFVRTNAYEQGRAHVTVFNWELADNVTVDLSSALTNSQPFRIRNAADFYGENVLTGLYTAPISLPMTNLTVATPLGMTAPTASGPEFNAFIVTANGTTPDPEPEPEPTPTQIRANRLRIGTIRSQ